ncbi:recombinase family protein [Microbacteriaceae bacterium 4G12]
MTLIPGRTYGYVRVSTTKQTVDQQLDALRLAGVADEHVFGDVRSGARWDREGLSELKRHLRPGDTLVVVALDRLGRSLSEMVNLLAWIRENEIVLRSLRESLDFSTPTGEMMAAIFAAMAQYERALIIERADAAREAARARGRQVGRPKSMTSAQRKKAEDLLAAGWSRVSVAADLGVSRATLYREIPAGVAGLRLSDS